MQKRRKVKMLDIREIIEKGENRYLEFKREVPLSLNNILKTIVSFSNDSGGDVLIGVDDKGNITGIDGDPLMIEERISNAVHDSCSPIPSIFYKILNINDKQIFNIRVYPGSQKPYFMKKEGVKNGVYVRIGSTNKKADTTIINELQRQNLNQTYDEIIYYKQNIKSLSGDLLHNFLDKYETVESDPAGILIKERYAVKTNGDCFPTVGAALLFSETLPGDLDYASVEINIYDGVSRENLAANKRVNCGLLKIVPLVVSEIKKHLWTYMKIEDVKRKDELEIPLNTIREAVINAVCHRDYAITGASTKADLFDNRLEIVSPGNLPIGITIYDLGKGTSEIRNKIITKCYRRMGYIEKLGTGITRMINECRRAGLPDPVFEEPGRFFKVTLQRKKMINQNAMLKKLISYLEDNKEYRTAEMARYLNVHPNTVLNYLKELIKENVVEKVGRGPNVRYRLRL